jgi:hypothetical protein
MIVPYVASEMCNKLVGLDKLHDTVGFVRPRTKGYQDRAVLSYLLQVTAARSSKVAEDVRC